MNYETNIKRTFYVDLDLLNQSHYCVVYFDDGSSTSFDVVNPSLSLLAEDYTDYTFRYVTSYVDIKSKDYIDSTYQKMPILYLWNDGFSSLNLVMNSQVDFVTIMCASDNYADISSGDYRYTDYELGDGSPYSGYRRSTYEYPVIYGNYQATLDYGEGCVYDRWNTAEQGMDRTGFNPEIAHGSEVGGYRFSGNGYYQVSLGINPGSFNSYISISYGQPIYDITDERYQEAKSLGYANGYTDGYDNGYHDGEIAGHVEPTTATAFNYIGKAFEPITTIMNLEVLPNISLGLCFSIPLVIVLIKLIFSLAKK